MNRILLLLGALGGTLWFIGDMLAYGYFGNGQVTSASLTAAMLAASATSIWLSGVLGPVGSLFCLLGVLAIYRAAKPGRLPWVAAACSTLVVLFVFWGSVHQLFSAKALAISTDPTATITLRLNDLWSQSQGLLQALGYISAFATIGVIAAGRTELPRWSSVINFGLISLLEPLSRLVPAPLGAPLTSGFSNIAVTTWFVAMALCLPTRHARATTETVKPSSPPLPPRVV